MQVKAQTNHLRISPRKTRLVVQAIRGLDVVDAENKLNLINKKPAKPLLKLLQSVISNAENNFELKKDNLFIQNIMVNEGPTLKRWLPRAFGRATPINKRTSHVKIILEEKVPSKSKKDTKQDKQKDLETKQVKNLDEVKQEGKTKNEPQPVKPVQNTKKPETLSDKDKDGKINRIFRRKSG